MLFTFPTFAEAAESLTFDHLFVNESLRCGAIQLFFRSVCTHFRSDVEVAAFFVVCVCVSRTRSSASYGHLGCTHQYNAHTLAHIITYCVYSIVWVAIAGFLILHCVCWCVCSGRELLRNDRFVSFDALAERTRFSDSLARQRLTNRTMTMHTRKRISHTDETHTLTLCAYI